MRGHTNDLSSNRDQRRRPILAPGGLCPAVAAAARRVSSTQLGSSAREKAPIARARQLAVYLQHVAYETSLSACARLFARDRATIRHACARIEDARDDPRFDLALQRLEIALRAQSDMFFHLIDACANHREGD
jgi:hypothetical protein